MAEYKRSEEEYKKEFDAAKAAIAPHLDGLSAFARENGLSYLQTKKPKTQKVWTQLVNVESDDDAEDGRQELEISLSYFCKPGKVYVHSLVEDLNDGRKYQTENHDISVGQLEEKLTGIIERFKQRVLANEGTSGREVNRQKMGTKYPWTFENEGDEGRSWTTEVEDINGAVESFDDGDTWSATVFDLNGLNDTFGGKEFGTAKEAILAAEAVIDENLKKASGGVIVKDDMIKMSDVGKVVSVISDDC